MRSDNVEQAAKAPEHLGWRAALMLAAFALLMFLPGFFTLPPIDRDEARFAQATRQMLESKDFVDIRFQETTRYKKPIGIYWLQSASVMSWRALVGDEATRGIWPYRFPSLVAAVASVVLTAAIGAGLFSREIGIVGGLLMALSMVLNLEARIATTDATLLASILAAQYALARAFSDPNAAAGGALPVRVALIGWVGFALGILVKGPIIVLVLAGTIVALAWQGAGMKPLLALRPRLGIVLTCLIVLPWLVLITLHSRGAFLQDSVGQDLLSKLLDAETAGRLPPGMHALMFWLGFWPGSLLVILALPWIWASRRDASVGFCLAWAIPTWVAFELPMTKLIHYVLPAYPPLALLAAAWIVRGAERPWQPLLRRTAVIAWSTLTAAICAAIIALPILLDGHVLVLPAVLTLLAAVPLAAVAMLVSTRPYVALVAMIASGPLIFAALGLTFPQLQKPFLSRTIAAMLPRLSDCQRPELMSSGYEEPSLVFLTTTAISFLPGPAAADKLVQSVCALAIIGQREEPGFLQRAEQLGFKPRSLAMVEGINSANSRRMVLTIYARPRP